MAAASDIMEYPLKFDRSGSLIWNTSILENHLIELNYNQTDVLRLTECLTLERNPARLSYNIRVRLQSDKREDVKYCDLGVLMDHDDMLRMLLQSLSDEDRIRLLHTERSPGSCRTFFHYIAVPGKTEIMQTILELLSEDLHYNLLCVHDLQKMTPIHWACRLNKPDVLEVILRLTSEQTRSKLLQIAYVYRVTPLHLAAWSGHTQCISIIADSITADQLTYLLRITDMNGDTPVQLAAEDNQHESAKLLQDYQTKALIDIALLHTDHTVREEQIQQIIEQEPLSPGQIEELSPYSAQYVIPHNQTKTKRYGLILYSTEHRHGAEDEAENFKQALETAGCDVTKLEWSHTEELSSMIDSSLEGMVGDCSLLIVAVMTHGYRGALRGSDNSEVPINNILFQLNNQVPKHVPLVMVIQACQIFTTHGVVQPQDYESDPATPSQVIDPHSNKHIVLRRPHTVLLLATVTGGLAIRGAFTGALADQIRAADGKTDIYTMFNRAVRNMIRDDTNQRPEMRITTEANLVLPPAGNNAASGGSSV